MNQLRNIAIIAHVDHGKTTLVDELLKQSGTFGAHQQVSERAMDSNDLEKERGITILAKCTAVTWTDTRINIVDTPGHADFGGEVERILSMVDGVVLLVDAAEGPMPQTKFVTAKALGVGLKPIVVINKSDKPDARPDWVVDQVFDLFVNLEATDDQLDFPVLYASAKQGWAVAELDEPRENMDKLFQRVVNTFPQADGDQTGPFSMLATTLEADPFLGRILTGRIHSGVARVNMPVKVITRDGRDIANQRLSKLLAFDGLKRVPVDEARAGDIVAIAGLGDQATVADTICDPSVSTGIQAQPIDPPTLAMSFSVNDSPLAGREGDKVTSRMIRDRLLREAEGNVAIRISESEHKDSFEVAGRGELQLGVLIENMRREGYELSISRPRVLMHRDDDNQMMEPIEEVVIDVDDDYSGVVVEKMAERKGEMTDMRPSGAGKTRMTFLAPSRGLIGYYGEFLTDTRGTGIMNRLFHSYGPYRGAVQGRRQGVLVANGGGNAVAYALFNLEDRGELFITTGEAVYEGMLIGEHSRGNDLDVNPLKAKQLTNVRASGKDEGIKLTPARKMSLEQALSYIQDDELVEVTPQSIRLRKLHLCPHARKRHARAQEALG